MKGLGFFIWQLANMPAPDVLAAMLSKAKVKWAAIKVLNGTALYNAKGGNQKLLKSYWAALKAAGVDVGGWHYVYGEQPGLEGDMASEFIQEFDPAFFIIDAEGEMKRFGAARAAKAYCDKLSKAPLVYLCSYRFPSQHGGVRAFPFNAYLKHERVDGAMPQVYWAAARNPIAQLEQSQAEYRQFTNKPFIPIGATFGADFVCDSQKIWWEPTVTELQDFTTCAKTNPAYGFYSLDYIIRNNRMDWFEAVTGGEEIPIPPPPLSDHEMTVRMWDWHIQQGHDI